MNDEEFIFLERPSRGADYTTYVNPVKIDYKKDNEKCTASCLEELKACTGYNPNAFVFMSGCAHCGRSGKCMRGDK